MERLLTIKEVAEWLGTSERHVRELVFTKRVDYIKVGGKVRFLPDDIRTWVEANRQKARPTVSDEDRAFLDSLNQWGVGAAVNAATQQRTQDANPGS
jgi:excisionase family DNA binding protein